MKLKPGHNHQTASAAAYSKNAVSNETRVTLERLFQDGHCPMLALEHLKLEAEENIIKLADRSIIPSRKYCTRYSAIYIYMSENLKCPVSPNMMFSFSQSSTIQTMF